MPSINKASNFVKRNSMWIFIGLLVLAAIVLSFLMLTKTKENFNNPISNKKLEYFYMKECGHCEQFKPVWEELVKEIKNKKPEIETKSYEVSSPEGNARADKFKVTGTPTILLTQNDAILKEYSGERTVASIMAFLNSS